MKTKLHDIGRERAIALAETKWWVGRPAKEVALIGLLTKQLCLPFDVLHEKLEEALGRPVFTHELGLNFDGIIQELHGERDAPSFDDIVKLIPPEKLIFIHP